MHLSRQLVNLTLALAVLLGSSIGPLAAPAMAASDQSPTPAWTPVADEEGESTLLHEKKRKGKKDKEEEEEEEDEGKKKRDHEHEFGKIALNGEVSAVNCPASFSIARRNGQDETLNVAGGITVFRRAGRDPADCEALQVGMRVHTLAWRTPEQTTALLVQLPRIKQRFHHLIGIIKAVGADRITLEGRDFTGDMSRQPTMLPTGYVPAMGDRVLILALDQGGVPVVLLVVKLGGGTIPSPSPSLPSPSLSAVSDQSLSESNLNGRKLTLTLASTTFVDSTLATGSFTLNNAPSGVTVGSVTWKSATSAEVALAYSGADFDVNVSNFSVTVAGSELAGGSALTSNSLTIVATVETAGLSVSADQDLKESTLDGRKLTLTLSSTTFADDSLAKGSFTLNNAPSGVTVGSVTWKSATSAEVVLAYSGADFDVNVTNFSVTVAGSELASGSALTSSSLTIIATVEPATLTVTADVALKENTLNGRVLTLVLSNASFADSTLAPGSVTLNNAPSGLTVGSVTWKTATSAEVVLAYTPADFDTDITTFSVTIAGSELTSGSAVTSGNLTITAVIEQP